MNINQLAAAAVLAATIPFTGLAQQPTSPVAPRTAGSSSSVDGKVAVINTGRFYDGIQEIKIKQDQVQKKFDPRIKDLEGLKKQMETLQQQIQQQQSVLGQDKLQQMADQLADMQRRYQRSGEDLQAEVQKDSDTALGPIRQKLAEFVKGYATQRNIILILDKSAAFQTGTIAYVADAIDVTEDFIVEYNKANPVPGAAAAPGGAKPGGK
jgi:Skp family chaperone for outer membrane proteins